MVTLVLFSLLAQAPTPVPVVAEADRGWHRAVGLLQYLEGDYPGAVRAQEKAELEEQLAFAKEAVLAVEALGPKAEPFLERVRAVQQHIEKGDAPAESVAAECGALARSLIDAAGLKRSPRHPPQLERGKQVYSAQCQSCHGPLGDGAGPAAQALNPPPANFHEPGRMAGLTPYKAFNTTTFGITGTAMAPFPSLSDDDRWAVAFYLFTFRQPVCSGAAPSVDLETLATATDGELAQAHGAANVACLRRTLPVADRGQSLAVARAGVERALASWKAGHPTAARQQLIDAYLEGVEPIEPLLKARNPGLVSEIEGGFGDARTAAQNGHGFEAATGKLLLVLARADQSQTAGTFWSVFFGAALILLREGFEAMVVVAALLAVLKKLGATGHARTVHAGWVSALLTGAALYFFGQEVLGGARRELLETGVSFAAVAMLLYAALWLNARANISQHMGALRGKMQSALTQQSAAGLFVISFSAVLRETAETALFLQGLASDSRAGTAWGAAFGLVWLAALVAFVSRAGFRLPMKALFTASTGLLLVTSVVLLGKGMHGLQELGYLSLAPFPFFHLEVLGLYPDAWSALPQVLLVAAIALFAWLKRGHPLPGVGGGTPPAVHRPTPL